MTRTAQKYHLGENGFAVYTLSSDFLELQVIPQLGARIACLKSFRSGRDWMFHGYEPPRYFTNQPGDDFGESPLLGVDECVPSVGPCEWNGRKIFDHGEVWSQPWEVDMDAWKHGAILTRVTMPVSPFQFERSIRLEGEDIQLDYRLTNWGRQDEVYLWAFHPLINIMPGDRIELPAEVQSVRIGESSGFRQGEPGDLWSWPEPYPGVYLDDLDRFGDQRSAKLFVDHVGDGCASIVNRQINERFNILWDTAENPALGIWICSGIWNGYYQMALEPTNVAAEFLSEAAENPVEFKPLHPGESRRWQLRIRVDPV